MSRGSRNIPTKGEVPTLKQHNDLVRRVAELEEGGGGGGGGGDWDGKLSDSAVPSTSTNEIALFSGNGTGAIDNELYYRKASNGTVLRVATSSDVTTQNSR